MSAPEPLGPLARAAYQYLSAGLAIIALDGKQPNVDIHKHGLREPLRGRPDPHGDHPRGRNGESTDGYWYDGCPGCHDDRLLQQVFEHVNTSGVGIVIEAPYVVVDIDGEVGAEELRAMTGTVELPPTPVAQTSRGLHIWFEAPEEMRTTKLGTKLDLKGVGGYVAAPPSKHPSGHVYTWLVPLVLDGIATWAAELPAAITDHVARQRALVDEYRPLHASDAPASLDALVRHVRRLEEGNRNAGLHWAASAARSDGFSLEQAMPPLVKAAEAIGLDRQEAMTAIRSAYRRPQ